MTLQHKMASLLRRTEIRPWPVEARARARCWAGGGADVRLLFAFISRECREVGRMKGLDGKASKASSTICHTPTRCRIAE